VKHASRGRLSSLDLLPPEAEDDVTWAFGELRKRKLTQGDILDQLNLRLRLKGLGPISSSAFNRAAVRAARMAHRLGEVREIAAALTDKFEDGSNEQLTILAAETIKTMIFETLENAGQLKANPLTAEMIANFALALKSAEQAKKVSADMAIALRKNFERQADAALDAVARTRGLTDDQKLAIRAELFGRPLPPPETRSPQSGG
jgi:hypothetical protein